MHPKEDTTTSATAAATATEDNNITPRPNDVLFGRGTNVNRHDGNMRFRELVREKYPQYIVCTRNHDKDVVSREIARDVIDSGGRFLTKCAGTHPQSNTWENASEKTVVMKVKQAMRDHGRTFASPERDSDRLAMRSTGTQAANNLAFRQIQSSRDNFKDAQQPSDGQLADFLQMQYGARSSPSNFTVAPASFPRSQPSLLSQALLSIPPTTLSTHSLNVADIAQTSLLSQSLRQQRLGNCEQYEHLLTLQTQREILQASHREQLRRHQRVNALGVSSSTPFQHLLDERMQRSLAVQQAAFLNHDILQHDGTSHLSPMPTTSLSRSYGHGGAAQQPPHASLNAGVAAAAAIPMPSTHFPGRNFGIGHSSGGMLSLSDQILLNRPAQDDSSKTEDRKPRADS